MTPNRVHDGSLRLDGLAYTRLAWALVISIVFHLLCYGGYEAGKELGIWQAFRLPDWLKKTKMLATAPTAKEDATARQQEVPMIYLDVNPQVATAEAPNNAKYYSDKNSRAANPEADKDTNIPKIEGKQTEMAKTEDVKRSPFDKLQPVFPASPQDQEPEPARPTVPTPPGDLAMAKPAPRLRTDTGTAEKPRPRTIKEALMRMHRDQLVGEKMKQEGGIRGSVKMTSLDAKATPFGAYDAAFIQAVEQRWFDLLDNMSYDGYRRGKVSLQFHLTYDGRITDMKVVDNTVGEMLGLMCQKAVFDPAPFGKWPREMRLMVDKNYREIQFTFFYN